MTRGKKRKLLAPAVKLVPVGKPGPRDARHRDKFCNGIVWKELDTALNNVILMRIECEDIDATMNAMCGE